MSAKQMSLCDAFVYIPQHGPGTASLNVTVAASVVLHHFAVWAGFPERERRQHKFVVAERPERNTARGVSERAAPFTLLLSGLLRPCNSSQQALPASINPL